MFRRLDMERHVVPVRKLKGSPRKQRRFNNTSATKSRRFEA